MITPCTSTAVARTFSDFKTCGSGTLVSFETLARGAFHRTCHQWQMTVFVISYWNPCFWLVISRFVTDFCHLSLKKCFVKRVPGGCFTKTKNDLKLDLTMAGHSCHRLLSLFISQLWSLDNIISFNNEPSQNVNLAVLWSRFIRHFRN